MKWKELTKLIDDKTAVVRKSLNERILENVMDYFVYKDGSFHQVNTLHELEIKAIVSTLSKGDVYNDMIFDEISKGSIDNNKTMITISPDAKGIVINSQLKGKVSFTGPNALIKDSTIEDSKLLDFAVVINRSNVDGSKVGAIYFDGATVMYSNVFNVYMEKGSLANSYSFLANGVVLRKNALVAPNCNIVANSFEYHRPLEYYSRYDTEEKIIEIGENAWLGANSSVIKGCRIGDWSIVSAGTVISEDVDDFTLAAGDKRKSIIERIETKNSYNEVILKVLSAEYPAKTFELATVYNTVLDFLRSFDNQLTYLKLFYMYAHSENLKKQKRVVLEDELFVLDYDRYIFEFYSPDRIQICTQGKRIMFFYSKNYPQIDRKGFLEGLCDFGIVEQEEKDVFSVGLDEQAIEKLRKIDELFDEVVTNGVKLLSDEKEIPFEKRIVELERII